MDELYNDEQILLQKVALGDRKAFNQLYCAYIEHAYNYIYLFTKSKEDTEDILQDVFVNIWENRQNLATVKSFKHYVIRAAKNKLINQVRHRKIKNRVLKDISQSTAISQEITEYEVTYKEYGDLFQEAVERLPPKRKLIFRMNIEEGASYAEIAEQLNISISVVKKQFYSASSFVRQYLCQNGEILFLLSIVVCFYPFFK